MSQASNDLWTLIAKQGVFALMLCLFAGWFGMSIVVPMRDDQRKFMDSVIDTNKQHAAVAAQLTAIQQSQANTLSGMQELLRQIRDDQRSGAWNRPNGTKYTDAKQE